MTVRGDADTVNVDLPAIWFGQHEGPRPCIRTRGSNEPVRAQKSAEPRHVANPHDQVKVAVRARLLTK
jgi:hypothetical protein